MRSLQQNQTGEWSFTSSKTHADPFHDVELDVCFQPVDGGPAMRVPAFWAGGQEWRVRFAASATGAYRFRSECSDPGDTGLQAQEGSFKPAFPASCVSSTVRWAQACGW
jgi:hypothetical protein